MKLTTIISFILVLVGALVWLVVGLFNYNIVDALFGTGAVASRIIYSVVGIAALWMIFYYALYRPMLDTRTE